MTEGTDKITKSLYGEGRSTRSSATVTKAHFHLTEAKKISKRKRTGDIALTMKGYTPASKRARLETNAFKSLLPLAETNVPMQTKTPKDIVCQKETNYDGHHKETDNNRNHKVFNNVGADESINTYNTGYFQEMNIQRCEREADNYEEPFDRQINDVEITRIVAHKTGSYNVKVDDDIYDCRIQGIAITPDGRQLLADNANYKIKMFSSDMEFISSIKTRGRPLDITCISNQEAAVVTLQKSLVIINISNEQMSIKSNVTLTRGLWSIAKCKDEFAVTCPFPKPHTRNSSVTLYDKQGKVCWSASKYHQNQALFSLPFSVSSYDAEETCIIVVSDAHMNKLISLNGETGEVINEKELRSPGCVTTDNFGNIFLCYKGVSVLSSDFSQERLLLSVPGDLQWGPLAMAYDSSIHKLFLSYNYAYNSGNFVDCFKLESCPSHNDCH